MIRGRSRRRAKQGLLGLAALFCMTGCQYTSTPADLLGTPRLTNADAALSSAIQEALPQRAKLTLPERSASDSAVSTADLDGDGVAEAVVTFAGDNDTEHVMVLKKTGDAWKTWFTFAESSVYGIDWLQVEDLDRDGTPEVLIGWNQYGNTGHKLDFYHIDKGMDGSQPPRPFAELPYEMAGTGEVNGDGHSEIAVILLNRDTLKASVQVYGLAGNKLSRIASSPLDGTVNSYNRIAIGKIAPHRYGLLTYAGIGAHSTSASMLAWENGKLEHVSGDQAGISAEDVVSDTANSDINGDGIIDLHVRSRAPGQHAEAADGDAIWIDRYLQWDGSGSFKILEERYEDAVLGYAVKIPAEWHGRYAIRRPDDTAGYEAAFDYYDGRNGWRAELFRIRAVPAADWKASAEKEHHESLEGNAVIAKAAGFVYEAVWDKPPAGLPERAVKEFERMRPDESRLKLLFSVLTDDE